MTTDKDAQDNFDQEAALTTAEKEVWGPFADATHEIAPRPEFAAQLEARLLAAAEPLAQTEAQPIETATTPILTRPPSRSISNMLRSGRKLFQLPQARFASVGLALGLVMVAVLVGMAALSNV